MLSVLCALTVAYLALRRLVWHNVWIPLTSEGLELATYLDQADDETRRLVRTISLGPSGPQDRVSSKIRHVVDLL